MSESLIIQQPSSHAQQLVLLFHGVGGTPDDMLPLGQRLAREFPQAFVVSVRAPQWCDFGAGFQWFSVREITDENRVERVAEAMPSFVHQVRLWQHASGASTQATALIGFSQGAIMALESTQFQEELAGRVVGIAGRFAQLPSIAPPATTLHLFHGKQDDVVHYAHAVQAAERLVRLGADVTADVIPFVGHEINAEIQDLLVERLKGYIPKRSWDEALRGLNG